MSVNRLLSSLLRIVAKGFPPGWDDAKELTSHEAEAILEQLTELMNPLNPEFRQLARVLTEDQEDITTSHSRILQAEARYRALVEQIPAVTFMAPLDGAAEEIYVSPQIEKLLGWSAEEWLANPLLWYRQLHPDDRQRWHEEFVCTFAIGERFRSEYRFLARDGRVVWIHGEAQIVYDADGTPLFLQGMAFDITERKLAEETRRNLHAELERQVQQRTAELAQANDVLQKEIGERKRIEEALRRAHDELEQRVAERTTELARTNASLQEQIVVRRRAEAALQREEQFLKAVLENTADAVVACDAHEVLILFNEAARRLHGSPSSALTADQWALHYALYHADGSTPLKREEIPLVRALKEEVVRDVEIVIVGQNGQARSLLASGQAIYDSQGSKLGAVVSMHDITLRKRAEEERAGLIRAQAARAEAEAASRAKDEFLALLGHELRNPLAPIRTAVKLLTLKGDDAAVVAQARDIIGRQTAQMTRLVDELLDASRIAQGKIQLKRASFDLAALVRAAGEDHRVELESAGLTLAVEVPAAPVWIHGDAARLTQVVGNLLHNAQKFTDPGGRVTVRLAEEEGKAMLSVEDTGVGIAAEALPKLFEVFSQVDATLERSKGGLGLGLSVVKGLAELHGGQARAVSAGVGRGATFTVWLPLDQGPPPTVPNPADTPCTEGGQRKVLIVEDGRDAAESLRMLLSMQGFEVAVAHTGPDGVALARRFGPDVVVCDLGLPGMSGFEVAQTLRADPLTASALLVCLSGYGQEQDRRQAREAGFDETLVKPADPESLVRLLSR